MKSLRIMTPIIILAALGAMIWVNGCEVESSETLTGVVEEPSALEEYFPFEAGKSIVIASVNSSVTPNITSLERYTIGDGLERSGQRSYSWIHTNLNYPLISDTGYFYQNGDAIYFYEHPDATPEKIFELPLTVGNSWYREDISDINLDDNLLEALLEQKEDKYGEQEELRDDGKYTDPNDEGTLINGGPVGRIFPTVGSSYMTIVAVEDIVLNNGLTFNDCIKISNQAGQYTNYYWYAKGYGLIKYIIGATSETLASSSLPDGEIVAELNSFR